MNVSRRSSPPSALIALASFLLFVLPMALFLAHFRRDAPFYFLAEDSFYYLSIALHSAHLPFYSIDGLHPTNGFHPLWECLEFSLTRLPFFRLDGPDILPRILGFNMALVGTAVALLSTYVYKVTQRPWLAMLAFTPGLVWLVAGIGSPGFLNAWSNVNGMETGLEMLFFSLTALLFGRQFRFGPRFALGAVALGCVVLSRLDDVFFLLAVGGMTVVTSPRSERLSRLLAITLPVAMIVGYLLYNHHTVGVWMPVSGMAKVGRGYRATLGEGRKLLVGSPFWAMSWYDIAFSFSTAYTRVAQMLAPMAIAGAYLWWQSRTPAPRNPVLAAFALGVLLKGAYNSLRVPLGYQGAWYYGASLATANILLALFTSEVLSRWSVASTTPRHQNGPWLAVVRFIALLALSFLSFNTVISRLSQQGFVSTRDTYAERFRLTAALHAATSAPFLEFQDGELSFSTGLPAVSGFGLAADPEAVRAQHNGTFFDLLARRGVTVAAASGTYPEALAASQRSHAIFPIWGYNAREVENICFQPFWSDFRGTIVLYHIVHQPICPDIPVAH